MFSTETPEEAFERHVRREQEEARESAKKARKARADKAREDVNEFCSFVGKDSENPSTPWVQEEMHVKFQLIAEHCKRAIVMAHPESGKTTQLGILRTLFRLGKNPNLRVCIVSYNADNAKKTSRTIKEYIEKSEELAEVFPELLPSSPWKEDSFTIRRSSISRDFTVQALGFDQTPTGGRIDLLIFDDALVQENTSTPEERKKFLRRLRATFFDRLTADADVLFLTNAWHPEDAAHVLEKEAKEGAGRWKCFRFPVLDEEGNPSCRRWPLERIEEAREEMGPLDFARAHLCRAREDGENPFDEDAIEACIEAARQAGISLVYSVSDDELPPGAAIYTGVDLAVSKTKGAHLTSLTTVLLWPEDLSRQLLWVESGRWSSAEIRSRVLDHDRRYGSTFIVENNAAQKWIIDIVLNQADLKPEERRFPSIVPFRTGKNKAHPQFGVEGVAAEVATDPPRWLLPMWGPDKAAKEAIELKGEMLYYSRGAHTGDRLMSLWFAREGCRRGVLAGQRERKGSGEHLPAGGDMHKTGIPDAATISKSNGSNGSNGGSAGVRIFG